MKLDPETIPEQLRKAKRWSVWRLTSAGRKLPKAATNRPDLWTSFEEAHELLEKGSWSGLGLLMGEGVSGADLDHAIDDQGNVLPAAQKVLDTFCGAYQEVSPSGKGLKVFGLSFEPPVEIDFSKDPPAARRFKGARYFAVVGGGEGDPDVDVSFAIRDLAPQSAKKPTKAQRAAATEESLLDALRQHKVLLGRRGDTIDVVCPWTSAHTGGTCGPTDAGFAVENGKVTGFHCLHHSCEEKTLKDGLAHFGLRADRDERGFELDRHGNVRPTPRNARLAVEKLGVEFWFDVFADQAWYIRDEEQHELKDEHVLKLRFEAERKFGVLFPKELFSDVLEDLARQDAHHPVREYLDGLEWDGKPRIDTWLIKYGGAADSLYTRAVGRLVLVAAVKRIREPGVKFDELLVLESGQGLEKSNAIQALVGVDDWYTDALPLGADSKIVIERTKGRWIVEAQEMQGYGKREVDHLKAFLSTRIDGPVRLAYGRIPETKRREFIVIGTTNLSHYLKDMTGNRRFWPVEVGKFDVASIRADRDQLWAEAAAAEAAGESIRLDPKLWKDAGEAQEERKIPDPWSDVLKDALGDKNGKVRGEDVWRIVGVPTDRRTQSENGRISVVMKDLGFTRRKLKDGDKTCWGWVKGPKSAWSSTSGAWIASSGASVDPTWLGREEDPEL